MSRRRKFSDDECRHLAQWFAQLRSLGSVQAKCRELKASKGAVMDAIARGSGKPRRAIREKISAHELERLGDEIVSRGTDHSEHIDEVDSHKAA